MYLWEGYQTLVKNRSENLQEHIDELKMDEFKIDEMEERKLDKSIPSIKTQRAKTRKTE